MEMNTIFNELRSNLKSVLDTHEGNLVKLRSNRDIPLFRFQTWLIIIEELIKRTDRSTANADIRQLLSEADVLVGMCLQGIEDLATVRVRET
jgi:hypothetical protein